MTKWIALKTNVNCYIEIKALYNKTANKPQFKLEVAIYLYKKKLTE